MLGICLLFLSSEARLKPGRWAAHAQLADPNPRCPAGWFERWRLSSWLRVLAVGDVLLLVPAGERFLALSWEQLSSLGNSLTVWGCLSGLLYKAIFRSILPWVSFSLIFPKTQAVEITEIIMTDGDKVPSGNQAVLSICLHHELISTCLESDLIASLPST